MRTSQVIKDKILGFLDYLFRLVMINVLIIVPSFSLIFIYSYFENIENDIWLYTTLLPALFYLFPSIIAATSCIKMYEDGGSTGVLKEFFQYFKKFYVKSLIISLILAVIGILLGNSVFYFYQQMTQGTYEIINVIGFYLTLAVILILLFMMIHIPFSIVYFVDLSLLDCLKVAFMMAFKHVGKTILMLIVLIIFIVTDSLIFYFMAIGGISIPIYILVKISFKQYISIYRKL